MNLAKVLGSVNNMARYTRMDFSNEVKEISNPNVGKVMVTGRYDIKTRMRLDDGNITIRNLKDDDLVAKVTSRDIMHKVTLDEDQRPDLIALNFYGDPRLYWVILGANDLREKSEVMKGMTIRIPAKESLYGANGLLSR